MSHLTPALDRQMSNAQKVSYRSLRHMAGLALSDHGIQTVKIHQPVPLHEGAQAAVTVLVESWDMTIKADPALDAGPGNAQRSERTFLIEAGGCIAQVIA